MATNHTTNYNLNLWEANDKFVREEFNENSTKIDAAIKAVDAKANTKADASALTAETNARTAALNTLTQTVNTKAQIVTGTYTGNGAASRTINIGATPKAVILFTQDGTTNIYTGSSVSYYGGLALPDSPAGVEKSSAVEIVSGGFRVYYKQIGANFYVESNLNNQNYQYIAFI